MSVKRILTGAEINAILLKERVVALKVFKEIWMFLDDLNILYHYYCDFNRIDLAEKPCYFERVYPIVSKASQPSRLTSFRLYSAAVDIMKKNGFPQIVKAEEFSALNSPTLFHGAGKIKHLACFLADFDYHKGEGWFASGFYSTTKIKEAKTYAQNFKRNVLTFKLGRDAKVMSGGDLSKIKAYFHSHLTRRYTNSGNNNSEEYFKTLDPEVQERTAVLVDFFNTAYDRGEYSFVDELMSNTSTLAALLGYDAVLSSNIAIILNRGQIVISEHEFNRITNATRLYRHGKIHFNRKADREFIRE